MNTLRSFLKVARPCQSTLRRFSDHEVPLRRKEKGINQVNLLGRLGADPELRGTEEKPVCTFRIATNDFFTSKLEGPQERTDWHHITVFQAAFIEKVAMKLRKGDRVFISGKLKNNTFTDKEGQTHKVSQVVPDSIINLTKKFLDDQNMADSEVEM